MNLFEKGQIIEIINDKIKEKDKSFVHYRGIVRYNQINDTDKIIIVVRRKDPKNGSNFIDFSYDIEARFLKLISDTNEERRTNLDNAIFNNIKLKTFQKSSYSSLSFSEYFSFDKDYNLILDIDKIDRPELFI